jgi:hypothetical protein
MPAHRTAVLLRVCVRLCVSGLACPAGVDQTLHMTASAAAAAAAAAAVCLCAACRLVCTSTGSVTTCLLLHASR